jgi:hypothetical protein
MIPIALLALGLGLSLWDRLRILDRQALAARQRMAQFKALAARTPRIDQRSQAYAGFWSEGSDELLRQTFFEELEQFAGGGKLPLNLKPRPIRREGRVGRLGVELEVDATQAELLAFLDRVFAHPSLVELERLRIAPTASPESPLRATLVVNKVIIQRDGT